MVENFLAQDDSSIEVLHCLELVVLRGVWKVVKCCEQIFIFDRNRGMSIGFISGTIRKDFFIENSIGGHEYLFSLFRPKVIAFSVWFVSNKDHLLWFRRQLILLLFGWYPNISLCPKNPKVWNIRLVSIERFNGCLPIMTMHRLSIINMQCNFTSILPERSWQTSM